MLDITPSDRRVVRVETQAAVEWERSRERASEGLPPGWRAVLAQSRCMRCHFALGECPCPSAPQRLYYGYMPLSDEANPSFAITQASRPRPIGALAGDGRYVVSVAPPRAPAAAGVNESPDTPGVSAGPPWAPTPYPLAPLPPDEELAFTRALCTDHGKEDCKWFGSEAGCYAAMHGRKCDAKHTNPNAASACTAGEGAVKGCLKMGACSKRHRRWRSWQDAEAFYTRSGPYSLVPPPVYAGPSIDAGTRPKSSEAPYDEHLGSLRHAKDRHEEVCGRGAMVYAGGVEEIAARYGMGYVLACRMGRDDIALGVVHGRGLGRHRQGINEPPYHKSLRMLAERAQFFPMLGVGCPVPDRGEADPMGDMAAQQMADGSAAVASTRPPLRESFTAPIIEIDDDA